MWFVSLKIYLRYIFRRYCRKDWYIVLLCVRLDLGINFNPLDSAPIVVVESSVSDRLTMLLMLELWWMLLQSFFLFLYLLLLWFPFVFICLRSFRLDVKVVIWVSCNVGFVGYNSVCVEVSENFEFDVRCPVV